MCTFKHFIWSFGKNYVIAETETSSRNALRKLIYLPINSKKEREKIMKKRISAHKIR